jgi:hypothetical protein
MATHVACGPSRGPEILAGKDLAIVGEIDLDIAGEAGLELYEVVQNE